MYITHHRARIQGLTLIELLVVISIIGILASVVLASVQGHRERARDALRLIAMDQINTAIVAYTLEEGLPPGEEGVMYVNGTTDWIPGLVPQYLGALPVDPRNTTEHSFRYMRQGANYELVADLEYDGGHADTDGGISDDHYEFASGPYFALTDADESDWRFESASRVETHFGCTTPGAQVTMCHVPPGDPEHTQTLVVACTALGPEGHSNHEGDYLGSCAEGDIEPPADTGDDVEEGGSDDTPPPVDDEGGDDTEDLPTQTGTDCPVTISPAQGSYMTDADVQLSWDSTCYPSNSVMLEVRKVAEGGSQSFIMIYSSAPNDGDYPYQGFPSGLVSADEWVVRVTDYNTRTNWDESSAFMVTGAVEESAHTITASAGLGGVISPSGVVTVQDGASQTFSIVPAEGYLPEHLLVDGTQQATTSSYTFDSVHADHTIEATFAEASQDTITEFTIHGRFVHAFTDLPLPGVRLKGIIPPVTTWQTVGYSDANGEFTLTATMSEVEARGGILPFSYQHSCFVTNAADSLATIKKYADGHIGILHNPFDLIKSGSKHVDPVTSPYTDLGDVPLWPSKTIQVYSDVPAKFRISYSEEGVAFGNTLYKTQHKVTDIFALDYDVAVAVTADNGAVYTSPIQRYSAEADCADAILRLEAGVLRWEQ